MDITLFKEHTFTSRLQLQGRFLDSELKKGWIAETILCYNSSNINLFYYNVLFVLSLIHFKALISVLVKISASFNHCCFEGYKA